MYSCQSLGFFALIYVPSKLIVNGNATATANNIAASEATNGWLRRSGELPRHSRSERCESISQRLKPGLIRTLTARLKSCPPT
jgi:hypothetical protein